MASGYQQHLRKTCALSSFITWGFPNPVMLDGGLYNEVCRKCGNWTAEQSMSGGKYHQWKGKWEGPIPQGDNRIVTSKDGYAYIPICDKCNGDGAAHHSDSEDYDNDMFSITIMQSVFKIFDRQRMDKDYSYLLDYSLLFPPQVKRVLIDMKK